MSSGGKFSERVVSRKRIWKVSWKEMREAIGEEAGNAEI
jgi:hypothetical protein